MQEIGVGSLGGEDPLEEEMVTYSSNLAWKIPWSEEPGRLQKSQTQLSTHIYTQRRTAKKHASLETSILT